MILRLFNEFYKHLDTGLIVAYLGTGNVTDSKHSLGILKLLVKKLRKHWPDVQITFKTDWVFCRHKMFN